MTAAKLACIALGWALVYPGSLAGQRYSFRLYAREQGLTNLGTQCLEQDREGFLWVGTQDGLFRYDGERFERFGDALWRSTEIKAIHQAADGVLWAYTRRELVRREGGRFATIDLGDVQFAGAGGLSSDAKGRNLNHPHRRIARLPDRSWRICRPRGARVPAGCRPTRHRPPPDVWL